MLKELCVTCDFFDDLLFADQIFTREDFEQMMKYAASLGATRFEWILDTFWTLSENYPGGFDLLEVACKAAHKHGMRFDVVFKPFEGGMGHPLAVLPPCMPRLESVPLIDEPWGLIYVVRSFVAEHPEMRLARRDWAPLDLTSAAPIKAIRLVKDNDAPLPFAPEQLSIWTSSINGEGAFKRYEGPVEFNESVQWRPKFPPKDCSCRLLTLGGLDLPADARFFRIRYEGPPSSGFTNELDKIVELIDDQGDVVASTHSQGLSNAEALYERTVRIARLGLTRYFQQSEAQAALKDRERFIESCQDMYRFETGGGTHCTLNQDGEIVVMRGKPGHVVGALSPAYPEVRAHWLEHVQFCIDRGVDGVNIRQANHNRPSEPWSHGFNPPVLEQLTNAHQTAEATRINGNAYTAFLTEARDLLHKNDCQMGIHVHPLFFQWDDRHGKPFGPIMDNIQWQWEHWINDLADYIEFRGAGLLVPSNFQRVIDRIGLATREAGIPFMLQSTRERSVIHFEGPFPSLEHEMKWALEHPDITIYNLYEIAHFFQLNQDGQFEGSADMAQLVRETWPTTGTTAST